MTQLKQEQPKCTRQALHALLAATPHSAAQFNQALAFLDVNDPLYPAEEHAVSFGRIHTDTKLPYASLRHNHACSEVYEERIALANFLDSYGEVTQRNNKQEFTLYHIPLNKVPRLLNAYAVANDLFQEKEKIPTATVQAAKHLGFGALVKPLRGVDKDPQKSAALCRAAIVSIAQVEKLSVMHNQNFLLEYGEPTFTNGSNPFYRRERFTCGVPKAFLDSLLPFAEARAKEYRVDMRSDSIALAAAINQYVETMPLSKQKDAKNIFESKVKQLGLSL